jgi:hypothetical protein
MYWNNAPNVVQDLDKFSALYIKFHGCVWSECSLGDAYDDDGENRDGGTYKESVEKERVGSIRKISMGDACFVQSWFCSTLIGLFLTLYLAVPFHVFCLDENWYQYRTQTFCANAAYSLYGVLKKQHFHLSSCSRSTYINSFFTYGGADTVLQALGLHATTSFDSTGNDFTSSHPNAVCYAVDGENNNNGDGGGASSTMGCSADGSFAVAEFSGQTCDGNYFVQTLDQAKEYNRAFNGVRCKQIWNYRKHYSTSSAAAYATSSSSNNDNRQLVRTNLDDTNQHQAIVVVAASEQMEDAPSRGLGYSSSSSSTYGNNPAEILLSSSWACDISVYPKGCPDPFGLKQRYDAVLAAVSSGRSSRMAVTNARLRMPLLFLSAVAFLVGIGFWMAAYFVSNQARIQKQGLCPTVWHDVKKGTASGCKYSCGVVAACCTACWAYVSGAARRHRKQRRHQRREQKAQDRQARMEQKKQRKHGRRGGDRSTSEPEEDDNDGSPRSRRAASTGRTGLSASSSSPRSASRRAASAGRSTSTRRSKSRSRKLAAKKIKDVEGAPIEPNLHRYPSGRKSWAEVSASSGGESSQYS